MKPAVIHVNSYPGVGKLTISRILAAELDAKLLDNHSIYNVAFALTEFKSAEFYEAVRDVRSVAYRLVMNFPSDKPLILTNAHSQDSKWGNDCWDQAIELARKARREHLVVLLDCSREENARRIKNVDRDAKRKPRDPYMFRQGETDPSLIDRGADGLFRLDVTDLTAKAAAASIVKWLKSR